MVLKVFLTDTHWRTSYFVCKSLAKKGIKVIGLKTVDSIFDKSSYYSEIITFPSFDLYPDKWLYKIQQIASGNEILIPISLEAIKFVSSNELCLSKKLTIPPINLEHILLAQDKQKITIFMDKIGIPIPMTFYPTSLNEAEEAFLKLKPPVVIKLSQEGNIPPEKRYGIAYNINEFRKIFGQLSLIQSKLLVQEYIYGQGVGVSIIADHGALLAMFSHQRLREGITTGGPSTYCSFFDSKLIMDYASTFSKISKWNGVVMLEFKYNPDNKEFHFIETNPRFWGSMELAIESGVDFPFLFLEWVLGKSQKIVIVKSNTLKLKYLSMDIKAFTESLVGLNRKSRYILFFFYIREFIDPHLRLAYIDIKDWKVCKKEILSSVKNFVRLVGHAL